MVFSSIVFTFLFLPIVILIYYLAKEQYRNYILLVASLIFYSIGEPFFILVMLISILVNYFLALGIGIVNDGWRKVFLFVAVIANIGLLFGYKYLDFAIYAVNLVFQSNISEVGVGLPIGISFFTFQALSYVIDVYRKEVSPQKNPFWVALYISFFPQLIAGPIIRYQSIEKQILNRVCSLEQFGDGVKRFIIGFAKKIIIANNVANIVNTVFVEDVNMLSNNGLLLWLGSICFSLQIYFDFSGYSDMAIGLGKMFGFDFPENFDYPYISKSITDFWRRWHISLSSWFRDYVYIPLGGSRVGLIRHIFNLLIVWLLTGLWHGAKFTFVLWGAVYFALLVIEKYIIKPDRIRNIFFAILYRIVVLLLVNFAWVIFNADGLAVAFAYLKGMLGISNEIVWYFSDDMTRLLTQYGIFILLGMFLSTPAITKVRDAIDKKRMGHTILKIVSPVCLMFVFLWSISYLVLGAHNPFIYFNF